MMDLLLLVSFLLITVPIIIWYFQPCKHDNLKFLAPGYPDYQDRCQLNTYQCLDCKEIIQKYDEI